MRLDPARGQEGSGLGLAIARAGARAHGGDVVLLDKPGGAGACFALRALPPPGQQVTAAMLETTVGTVLSGCRHESAVMTTKASVATPTISEHRKGLDLP